MSSLSVSLREMARSQRVPLCDEWYGSWRDDDGIDVLLDRYVEGFDFAVKNDYPPLSFCREHFALEDLHRHHIYLDEKVTVDADNGYYVFLGGCEACVNVVGYKAVTVYARHTSRVMVTAERGARVFFTCYDDSRGFHSCDMASRLFFHYRDFINPLK